MRNRKRKLIVRWVIVAAGKVAIFWAIYYLASGNALIANSIKILKRFTTVLPFELVHWWDITIILAWLSVVVLALVFTNKQLEKLGKKEDLDDFIVSLVASLTFGWIFSAVNLGVGMIFSLTAGLAFSLMANGLCAGLSASFVFCMILTGVGSFFGLSIDPGPGLLISIALGNAFSLGFIAGILIKAAVGTKLWAKFWDWLLVR